MGDLLLGGKGYSGSQGCGALALLLGMGARGVSYPRSGGVGVAARGKPFRIARPIAFQHLIELGPIDRPELMLLLGLVPAQQWIGNDEVQELGLRHGEIDELLPQFIVRETLDLPARSEE